MASLQLALKARSLTLQNKPARLYRSIIREVPRVMTIYDIVHVGEKEVKQAIRQHFYRNAHVKDERIIDMLLERGYMDLEDTLLQHKQKNHLMLLIEGYTGGTDFNSKRLTPDSSEAEQFARWIG
ncbi:NADH dehydrogenase (ubiquinone) 1 alpha subcomplex subunit 6 [Fistulifera solaris]|uniref:NADH dehydrogenase (Ubiquinone) 1 alpha subcomplex subunit 6 n=1 Tax=Fistulifera solaris TaxID=1519565 RepID=A0A1Z5KGB8_FISSO|nr:NADH dehydrogenase (ubiquinone) 1 alpha subcomplex subunit 6 [Fistulifera solaris]|eukprot:GAX25299.1 NADH dehydrogenase (ubiquinone) 1 alpha subcomplex subunit 6 [Fistulifera solaris]